MHLVTQLQGVLFKFILQKWQSWELGHRAGLSEAIKLGSRSLTSCALLLPPAMLQEHLTENLHFEKVNA